ncbi:metal-dependent hydrolase [uncultured Methanocorpusculum sp.]|nr:metal-dependent hydrolase [uncultured Methanocorpusculum sp.]
MKGITHIILTMATMLVVLAPLTPSLFTLESIPAVIILLLGAFFGSLAPDIDKGKEAAIYHSEIPGGRGKKFPLTPIFGYALYYFCYKPLQFVFRIIFVTKIYAINGHRELPHSPIGILLISILVTIYLWLICFALSFVPYLSPLYNNSLIYVFGSAFLLGCFLHLLEDTYDNSGIHYFYPFCFSRLRGKIKGDGTDPRPKIFAVVLLIAAFVLGALFISGLIPAIWAYPTTLMVPIVLWVIFLKASGVPARKEVRE